MNPIHTQELHTMRVHVFASEADRLAAQAEGLVSQDDLVLTPDTGESLFEDMQAATDAANAAIARTEELSQEFEDALSGGILQGPPGPQGTPGTDGADGENGATFTPSLSAEGILSWTNDQGLQNPAAVSIRGPQGLTGATGAAGADGVTFTPSLSAAGVLTFTNDGNLPNPDPVDLTGPQGAPGANGADGADGENGATFTPSLSDEGVLSWTNDQGLQNPAAVSIRGPQGPTGPQGAPAVLSTHTGTLLLGEWVNAQQAVGISEIVPESLVIVSPTPESFSVYSAAGTRAFALAEGAVGFTYDTLPTDDMTVNIMILNGGEQA